jgi:hypothetical protein
MSDLAGPDTLLGTWSLARTIEDRRLGEDSYLTGVLDLTEEQPGLIRWQERATWHRRGGDVAVGRRLRVERADDGWWVLFEDGREFHPWAPGEPVVHDCAPDTYRGQVSGTPDGWSVTWEVTGPEKDYTMTTLLTPFETGLDGPPQGRDGSLSPS